MKNWSANLARTGSLPRFTVLFCLVYLTWYFWGKFCYSFLFIFNLWPKQNTPICVLLCKKNKLIFILQRSYFISGNWAWRYLLILISRLDGMIFKVFTDPYLNKINLILPMNYNVSLHLEKKNMQWGSHDDINKCKLILKLKQYIVSNFRVAFIHTYLNIYTYYFL